MVLPHTFDLDRFVRMFPCLRVRPWKVHRDHEGETFVCSLTVEDLMDAIIAP